MTQRAIAQTNNDGAITVQPGDSWIALSLRFQVDVAALQALNFHPNPRRQPAIGSTIILPETAVPQSGRLVRPRGNLVETAVQHQLSPWQLTLRNKQPSPYRPLHAAPVFVPIGNAIPRDLPDGFATLELSQSIGVPGQAVGFRAVLDEVRPVTAALGNSEMDVFSNENYLVGLTGTSAFFGTQQPLLTIQVDGSPIWRQPWQFYDPEAWTFQQITLTGTAAQIDQQSIAEERERLFAIWEQATPAPQWNAPFQLPISNFLTISSPFGARRSYNGGPYRTYHEGVDFSAYGGTAVTAPAAGTVVVAGFLYVRGGAVIIDHGLGIYTGFYHLSSLAVAPGDAVQPGQLVGEVGTTGLSTGNHLHWDLLVNGVWVDAQAWLDQEMACWILAGLNQLCE